MQMQMRYKNMKYLNLQENLEHPGMLLRQDVREQVSSNAGKYQLYCHEDYSRSLNIEFRITLMILYQPVECIM